jgi:hypothetical protein
MQAVVDITDVTDQFTDALTASTGVLTAGVALIFGPAALWLAVKVGKKVFARAG